MSIRPLIISNSERKAAAALVAFASREENWYKPEESGFIPGDRQEYCLHFWTYRTVFSWTLHNRILYRHMSVSVPGENLPNPFAVFTIAEMLGFTGGWHPEGVDDVVTKPGDDWQINTDALDFFGFSNCVTIVQRILR